MKIKICGICRPEDAASALEEGADLLGFIFAPGPRQADPRVVADIVKTLPKTVEGVAVFMNQPLDEVKSVLGKTGLSIAQLHGTETPEFAASVGARIIKTFTSFTKQSFEQIQAYDSYAYLLDLPKGNATRATIDFDWATSARKFGRIFAAGRLTAENVRELVRHIRPYGVDVASSVESAPGVKDRAKLRTFIRAARAAHMDTQKIKVSIQ